VQAIWKLTDPSSILANKFNTIRFYHKLLFREYNMLSLRRLKLAICTLLLSVLIFTIFTFIRYHSSHPQSVSPTTRSELPQDYSELFHIVTNFVPFHLKELRKNLRIDGKPPTDQQLEARMAEIFECLQRNLNNSKIAKVHVLVYSAEAINYVQSLRLKNSHNLVIHKNDKWPTMLDQIMYASKYLQGKTVIMCHQDNYIGEGWEKANHMALRRERLMYALTRHPSPSKCKGTTAAANCGEGFPYIGSHDAFVFYVNGPIDRRKLVDIDVTPNLHGIENIFMWVFKVKLNYRLLNPCKLLLVHHMHCISIRETGRKRINAEGKSALASYTNLLQ